MKTFSIFFLFVSSVLQAASSSLSSEEMCDLSTLLLKTEPTQSLPAEEEEDDPRWRRHRNHGFMPILGTGLEERLESAVVVFALPKGGAHLLYTIFELFSGKEHDVDSRSAFVGLPIQLTEEMEVFFSSILGSDYRRLLPEKKIPKIVMIRDPRDMLIAQLHWMHATGKLPGGEALPESWKTLSMDAQLQELLRWKSDESITRMAQEMLAALSAKKTLVIRFEDLIGEQGGGSFTLQRKAISKLSEFVGFSFNEAQLEVISEQASRLSGGLRKDQVGIFRSYFSEETQLLCQQVLGKQLMQLGYPEN